jgi:SAM-dependent methyltransferase
MAYFLPEARFVGVDLASTPLMAARRKAAMLQLTNLELQTADLRDFGAGWGQFDYVIAHGLYSWISPDARDRLLAVCGEVLTDNGVAFVSYNTLPGQHMRQMLREMILYHTRNEPEPERKIDRAYDFLKFLDRSWMVEDAWRAILSAEVASITAHERGGFYHDELALSNHPVYFHEFAAHAARHGLQYLGEADVHEMFDTRGALEGVCSGVLEREQYLDFLKARRFRQTLLCRNGNDLRRPPGPEQMDRILFSTPAKLNDGKWEGNHGVRITATDPDTAQVAGALGDAFPAPVSFSDLLPYAGSAKSLREILFSFIAGGFATPHVYDFPFQDDVTGRPSASRLARLEAESSRSVTNACHMTVGLDEIGRKLLLLLDGTRDLATIARDLSRQPDVPPPDEIARYLPESLRWMAHVGLLEA